MDNMETVLKAFQDSSEPLTAGQLAKITGIERKEVDKIMAKLKKEGKIISPKNCYWTINK